MLANNFIQMFDNIYNNMVKIINISNPSYLIYIAIDGVCPIQNSTTKYRRRIT